MSCKNCNSNRIMYINGKCSDLCTVNVPHLNKEHDGYAPNIPQVCDGDYIEFSFCLDCGMIQNFAPIGDELLLEELYDEAAEEDAETDAWYAELMAKRADEQSTIG